ncbi:MAG: VWA domain-containing protein, partial [Acidobacteriota bacterium]
KEPAKDTNLPEGDGDPIKIEAELVLIDVTVLDKNNRFISGLDASKFQIYEDEITQQIEYFSQDQIPISYGIVVDTSGSMNKRLPTVIKAAKTLINLSQPGDEFFILDMKDSRNTELVQEFTTNIADANYALDSIGAGGGTALLDGIVFSGKYAQEGKNRRKALIVISDGDERDSTISVEETLKKLRAYETQLYIIGFPDDLSKGYTNSQRSAKENAIDLINRLTTESGGQAYFPKELSELETIAKKINADLRSQYILGYYSSNPKQDGSFRRIQLKVTDNKESYSVRARSGYFIPKIKDK